MTRSAVEAAFQKIRVAHFELADALIQDARDLVFDALDDAFTQLNEELQNTELSRYEFYDQIVCYGEWLSSLIVTAYLNKNQQSAHLLDAHTLLVTDNNYTSASIDWKYTAKTILARVQPLLDDGKVVLTQGFIGADHKGVFTTLGREGSDFTAAVLANVLDAGEVSIWKDVPGLMNADPNRFDDTVKLNNISYHEAIELAFYGASVVHPKTIQPVQQKKIPLKVRSFYNPETTPSVIRHGEQEEDEIPKIIVKPRQVLLSIGARNLAFIAEKHLTTIFDAFSKHKIHVNLMQHSAVSFSVCFDEDEVKLEGLKSLLNESFSLLYNSNLTLLTIRHYNDDIVRKDD